MAPLTAGSVLGNAIPAPPSISSASAPTVGSPSPVPHPSVLSQLECLKCDLPPMIKFIPRAARQHCATLLTRLILDIVSKSDGLEEWTKFLAFGRYILTRPVKGGSRKNLSSIIISRCNNFRVTFAKGEQPVADGKEGSISKGKKDKKDGKSAGRDSRAALGRGVASRLEEGNFKGALRLLTSDDSLAMQTAATLSALKEKHPTAPQDRRIPPLVSHPQMSVGDALVRKALFSFPPGSTAGPDDTSSS